MIQLEKSKVITRICGGLGNQLFCYSAARRLALFNNAELVIDDITGFVRDKQYCRRYALDHFKIPCRKATSSERLEPCERIRRGIMKKLSQRRPFAERSYIIQEGLDFDDRLLTLKVKDNLYLEGLWQSEKYFKDVEKNIRDDLCIIPPSDVLNQQLAKEICNNNSVALHVRWFNAPGGVATHNLSVDYYQRAIIQIEKIVETPHYFLFSDEPEAARKLLGLPTSKVTFISNNKGDENAYADLWLMSQCRHFITANSTFSWWGAWLGSNVDKKIIAPGFEVRQGLMWWGFKGLLPDNWIKL